MSLSFHSVEREQSIRKDLKSKMKCTGEKIMEKVWNLEEEELEQNEDFLRVIERGGGNGSKRRRCTAERDLRKEKVRE